MIFLIVLFICRVLISIAGNRPGYSVFQGITGVLAEKYENFRQRINLGKIFCIFMLYRTCGRGFLEGDIWLF